MKNKSSYWVKTLQNGLIGGGISLLLGVVGLSLAFGKLYVISGVHHHGRDLRALSIPVRSLSCPCVMHPQKNL